jgi:hypothetical protein
MCIFSTKDYEDTLFKMPDNLNDPEVKKGIIEALKTKLCNDCDGCYVSK